jgi:hypothetical protein
MWLSGYWSKVMLTFPEVPKQVRDEVRQQFCHYFHAINVSNFREGEQLPVSVAWLPAFEDLPGS